MKCLKKVMMPMLAALLLLCIFNPISAQASSASTGEYTGYKQPVRIEDVDVGEYIEGIGLLNYSKYEAAQWDNYSSQYYYQKLSASEKMLYDRMYDVCMDYLVNKTDGKAYGNKATGFTSAIQVPAGLSEDDAVDVWLLLATNAPQFYFLNECYSTGSAGGTNYIILGMYADLLSGTARAKVTEQMDSVITSWMSQIEAKSTTLEKERLAHDLVIDNTTYKSATYDQSCVGVFLQGKAVCAGYAESFALLCNGFGLQTISVTSEDHEWNKVLLYGNWYNVDCTWDDSADGRIYTNYFNVNDSAISEGDHILEDLWTRWGTPSCTNATVAGPSVVYNGVDYSAIYNEEYYLAKNPDIAKAYRFNPARILEHFVKYGMSEGRQSAPYFDVYSYKRQYVDLRNAFGNNNEAYFTHYLNYGKREGRTGTGCNTLQGSVTKLGGVDYGTVFDYNYYISRYPDIKQAFGQDDVAALNHFVTYGMTEGRQGISTFDVTSYRNQYVDLRQAFGNDIKSYYIHYMKYGKNEGRKGTGCTTIQNPVYVYKGVDYSAVYNFNYYISNYSDLKRVYGNDDVGALIHFVNYGMNEMRQASENFKVMTYYNRYSDLRNAFGNDMKSYYMHYLNYGIKEGRSAK